MKARVLARVVARVRGRAEGAWERRTRVVLSSLVCLFADGRALKKGKTANTPRTGKREAPRL